MSDTKDRLELMAWALAANPYLSQRLKDFYAGATGPEEWLNSLTLPENKCEFAASMAGLLLAVFRIKLESPPLLPIPEYELKCKNLSNYDKQFRIESDGSCCARFHVSGYGVMDVGITMEHGGYACAFGECYNAAMDCKAGTDENMLLVCPNQVEKKVKDIFPETLMVPRRSPYEYYVSCWSRQPGTIWCTANRHIDRLKLSGQELGPEGVPRTWILQEQYGYFLYKTEQDREADPNKEYGNYVTNISYVPKKMLPKYMWVLHTLADLTSENWDKVFGNISKGLTFISTAFTIACCLPGVGLTIPGLVLTAMPFFVDGIGSTLIDPKGLKSEYKKIDTILMKEIHYRTKDKNQKQEKEQKENQKKNQNSEQNSQDLGKIFEVGLKIIRRQYRGSGVNKVEYFYEPWDHANDSVILYGEPASRGEWVKDPPDK